MKKLMIMTAMVLIAVVPQVRGMPTMTGGPYIGNSWGVGVSASGIGSYDLVAVRIISGADVFDSPAIRNISNGAWTMNLDGSALASFSGPSVTSLNWNLWFAGGSPTAIGLDWAFFDGDTLVAETTWQLSDQGTLASWGFSDNWQPTRADVDGSAAGRVKSWRQPFGGLGFPSR